MTTTQLSNKITNSRLRSYFNCQKRHYYEYELGLRKRDSGEALRKGAAFHLAIETGDTIVGDFETKVKAGIDAIINNYSIIPHWVDPIVWACEAEYVIALYIAHQNRWKNDNIEIIATEQSFETTLYHPDHIGNKSKAMRKFILAGKIDKIVKLPDGRLAVLEYKTASDDLEPGSDYWKRLRIDHQITLYLLAARELGYNVETILYDVTRKPQERPLKAWKEPYKKDGGLKSGARDTDETPEEYGQRIYDVMTQSSVDKNPSEYYFQRREIPRLEGDLDQFRWDVYNAAKQIGDNFNCGRHVRNSQACITVFGKCPYFDICVNDTDVTAHAPEGFEFLKSPHPELNS